MEHECAFSLKAVPRNKDVRTWPSAFAGRNRLMASWVNVSHMPGGAQSGGAAQDKSGDKSGQAQPGSQPSTQGQRGQRGPMDQTTGKGPQEQKDQNAQGKESPK